MIRSARTVVTVALLAAFGTAAIASEKPSLPSSMGLLRTACYGTCPSYRITIYSDGRVVFEAEGDDSPEEYATDGDFSAPVALGRHEFRMPQADAETLLTKFRATNFFVLKDRYDNGTVDAPEAELSFSDHGQTKKIWDNYGEKVGMPTALEDLQGEIDRVSNSGRLVRGDVGLVEILNAENYDFHAPDAGRMLVRAIARGSDHETIKGILNHEVSLRPDWDGRSIGEWAVQAAVTYGDVPTLNLLAERGELDRLSVEARNKIAANSPICDLDKIEALRAIGIDPIQAEKTGGVAVLKSVTRCSHVKGSQVPKLVHYYLAKGADPNAADGEGETSIFDVWDPEVIEILVKHGADLGHLNKEGQSAVFSTWDEDTIVRLLAAGVKPIGDYFGTNFWDYAGSKKWAKVIVWLEAHPEMKAVAQGK